MFKKACILTAVTSMLIVGCSNDQNYKREVDGNDDYLKAPALKPLTVPTGMTVPTQSSDYYVYTTSTNGELGKKVDIRPPLLPIPTIADAYATYDKGVVTLDAPANSGVWNSIPTTLKNNNIAIAGSDNNNIQTANTLFFRNDESLSVDVAYLIQRYITNSREYVTVRLTGLKRMGQDVTDSADIQRYTVSLFNKLMEAIAPAPAPIPPSSDTTKDNK
ncbi:outer membrane protein assembly factor BamC [Orbaceae bacterium ESL0727]|nr:outer membrane protein assembly factor BamC [Orbaceae bacterium ESL0727]